MARISGIDLPKEKRIEIALTYIYGIGRSLSKKILSEAQVDKDTRVKDLAEDEISRLRNIIDQKYEVEGDLRRDIAFNIKRLMDVGAYRGLRHRRSLPSRGQRTHTNARTRKGKKRMAVGLGKKALKKK